MISVRRRGFETTSQPGRALLSLSQLFPVVQGSEAPGGQIYSGYTPTIYADSAARGNGSGSSEGNATTFAAALATVSAAGAGIVGVVTSVISGIGSGTHWESIFSVTGSGTSLSPIIVVTKYPSTQYPNNPELWTELRSGNTAVPQPVIGVYPFRSNVRFIGFYINQVHVPPAASNGSALAAYETSGIWFERFTFDQVVNPTNDNYNSVFSGGSNGIRIRNCRFRGGAGSGNHNAAAVTTYGPENVLFEHNEFEGCNCCFFLKGLDTNDGSFNSGIIRFNKSTGASGEFVELTTIDPVNGVDVYQNLSIGDGYAFNLDNSGSTVTDTRIYNNTVIDPVNVAFGADTATLADSLLRNNLVYFSSPTSARAVDYGQNSTASVSPMDWNLYFVAGGTPQFRQSSTIHSGLAAWRTATGKEANSLQVDPQLTTDYKLQVGSPARTAGNTGGPVGAYITGTEVIGIEP